jgi:hypothetical protein
MTPEAKTRMATRQIETSEPAPLAPKQIATLLDASRRMVVAEMTALGVHATYRPIPGTWCANEVLGHLIEAERRGFEWRIRSILAEDRPRLETWVPPAVAASRRDDLRDPEELVAEFGRLRDESLLLARSLGPNQLARVGIHPQIGEVTVHELLHEWIHHDRNHVAQILALSQRLVWPSMGNARRFVDPSA